MNLESPKVNVAKSAEYLFNALNDVKNFEKLMPENIAKFEVIDENCFEFGCLICITGNNRYKMS